MNKPSSRINWMPLNENPEHIAEPSPEKKGVGFVRGEKPPRPYFNWFWKRVGQWLTYFEKTSNPFDVVIGSGVDATHETLEDALADDDVGENVRVLIRESFSGGSSPTTLDKAGWHIYARPGVTMAKGSASKGLILDASGIEVHNLRFADYSTGGDKAIELSANAEYCRITGCRFADCSTNIDDGSVPAGKKPVVLGNITEVP